MAVVTGRVYVPAPNRGAEPRYGLFNAATGPLDLPLHARDGGLMYETGHCALPSSYDVTCAPGATKSFSGGYDLVVGNPFVVIASASCGTVGTDEQRASDLILDRLKAGEQATVENVFGRGLNGELPSLANNTPNVTLLSAATSWQMAISSLENYLYTRYGLPGIIHAPISAAAFLHYNGLIYTDVTKSPLTTPWLTAMGTEVVFGNYGNLNPDGTAPSAGVDILYITGQMAVWRDPDSEIFVSPYGENINRTTNQFYMVAERTYVVAYECAAAAIAAPAIA